ncbi:DUF2252 domain-containing protein [Streptoalloteichus hindustanus]|nr:DUF2252 domain-containing protein [Streptoalloteichus hindustanus]
MALRDVAPHAAHDHPALGPNRPAVLDYVTASNEGRLNHLVPLRIGRMLASPFAFYRGAAGLMAADLVGGPVSGLSAQICGDAHAANFGLYGATDGTIVMDVNDFDETLVGPWEWDLKRLAASLVLAGRVGGVSERGCQDAAEDAVRSYRLVVAHLAEQPFLESWTAPPDKRVISRARAHALLDDFTRASDKARKNTSAKVAAKWTRQVDHATWRFVENPPVLTHVDAATAGAVARGLVGYVETLRESRRNLITRYTLSDVAFRVVGTGSVGLRSYVALLHGNGDEALVLQLKESRPSALAPYLGSPPAEHDGRRVVEGTRLVQTETDVLLGWTTVDGRPFLVRQFRNKKGDIDPTRLNGGRLDDYGRLAGALLARAHARSIDPRVLAGYCGEEDDHSALDDAVGRFAVRYADQTEQDHAELARAVKDGRLPALTGV